MGWTVRGRKRYYYRSVRSGGIARRVYLGTGRDAEAAAAAIEARRAARQQARGRLRDDEARYSLALEPMRRLDGLANVLTKIALATAGYHRANRGPWRRRRTPC